MAAAWFALTLVVASFAVMAVDLGMGVLALATVVLVILVGAFSYARSAGVDPVLRLEVR
jgi:hypothetical protein